MFCLLSLEITAQTDSTTVKRYQVAFVPHYNLISAVRIDFEFKFKNKNQYLQFTPRFYFNTNDPNFSGAGTGLFHKLIFNTSKVEKIKPYFSYGVEFTNYIISPFDSNKYKVDSYRFSAMLGFQLNISKTMFLDFYSGIGYTDNNSQNDNHYGEYMYEPEYSGFTVPSGFRIGFMF